MIGASGRPALTQAILSTPRAVYALFCVVAIAMLVWKELRITSRTRTLVVNLSAVLIANIILAVVSYAMFDPEIGKAISDSLLGESFILWLTNSVNHAIIHSAPDQVYR